MRPRTNRGLRFIRCEPWNCVLPTQADLIRAPIRRHPVVVVNLDFAAAVAPVEVLPGAKRRRALQFLLSEIEMIGAERAIVSQARPGNRDMLLSHAEETPEAEHRVSNVSADSIMRRSMVPILPPSERRTGVPSTRSLAIKLWDWRVDVSVCMAASISRSTSASALGEPRPPAFENKRLGGLCRSGGQNSGGTTPT